MKNQDSSDSPSSSKSNFFREWLEKLQQESWQLELLISGFALYGIYESKGLLIDYDNFVDQSSNSFFLESLGKLLEVGWEIFFFNLLVHVVLRALWIGAIGLRYVSGEIEYDDLGYNEYFTKYLERKVGDYDDFIERLEKFCSVLFSYTFLLFLLFLSIICFAIVGILPFVVYSWWEVEASSEVFKILGMLWGGFYMFFGILVFADFVSLGSFRKIEGKTFSRFYAPIYKFYSIVTLTILYRPLIYNFIDSKYTRRLFYFSFPYILFIIFHSSLISSNITPHFPRSSNALEQGILIEDYWYADLYKERIKFMDAERAHEYKGVKDIQLSHYFMKDDFATVFLKIRESDYYLLKDLLGIQSIYKQGWSFSLFSRNRDQDENRTLLIEKYNENYDRMVEEAKPLRQKLRKLDEGSVEYAKLKVQVDSLKSERVAWMEEKEIALNNYTTELHLSIIEGYKSLMDVKIDQTEINDKLNCYLYSHPNNEEKGILCNFSTGHLSKGNHHLDVTRRYYFENNSDSLRYRNYKLPFIKM